MCIEKPILTYPNTEMEPVLEGYHINEECSTIFSHTLIHQFSFHFLSCPTVKGC